MTDSATTRKMVALLPMKAHSQRVPGKNFRQLVTKPLYKWILDTLLSIPEIDLVLVNTDADHILKESGFVESSRVKLRDRKKELCGDMVSMNLILADDIAAVPADAYLMTHTTNPLLSPQTIRKAIHAFEKGVADGTADSLFTVTKRQTRFYRADGSPVNHDPNNLLRTQDLEPWFEENSNLYLFSRTSFEKTNARIGAKPILFETNKVESSDIDDPEDWDIAEALARRQLEQA